MNFKDCPRCGWRALEKLKTYSYCINCNYNTVEDKCIKARRVKKQSEKKFDIALIQKVQKQVLKESSIK